MRDAIKVAFGRSELEQLKEKGGGDLVIVTEARPKLGPPTIALRVLVCELYNTRPKEKDTTLATVS